MNKKVDEEFKNINDVYLLQCICTELKDKIDKSLDIAFQYSQIDGEHHKSWCIDQMVKELAPNYKHFIKKYENNGEYKWDKGITP